MALTSWPDKVYLQVSAQAPETVCDCAPGLKRHRACKCCLGLGCLFWLCCCCTHKQLNRSEDG